VATPGMQLMSRIINTGEMQKAEEWGISVVDMLTTEEVGMWNHLRGFFHSKDYLGSIPGPQVLRNQFPNFVLCDDPHMTLEGLCAMTRRASVMANAKNLSVTLSKEIEIDPAAALAKAQSNISKLLGYNSRTQDYDLHNVYEEILSDYERAENGQDLGKVVWPWKILQNITGGIHEDDFIVFYGRPKSMKSWVLCYLISQCYAQGLNVLVYTKEMTPKNILKRVVGCLLKLPYQELRRGKLTPGEKVELVQFHEELKELRLKQNLTVLSGKDAEGGDTIQWLQSKILKYKPDIVFVDGLYLMSIGNTGKQVQDWQRVMQISRDARQMQLSTKVPLVATMQANRKAAQHGGAELDEIAHSDAIAQDATAIFRTIREKVAEGEPQTIALVAGGNREYALNGIRINGVPAQDFSEVEILKEKDVMNAKEGDKSEGAEEKHGAAGTRKKNSKANGKKEFDSSAAINQAMAGV
jgi:replicative DNA helicase